MIKFFRKIRKSLIVESKMGKYLTYAIGEIALVIIGILLALQINNWNEARKVQRTNHVLITNLMGEMDLNIDRLIQIDSLAKRGDTPMGLKYIILNTDTAIQYLDSGLDSAKIEWIMSKQLIIANSYNLHSSVYEEMKNTGRLYSLGSDSLLQKIDRYYRRLEREEYYGRQRNNWALDSWNDCKYGMTVFQMDYASKGISSIADHPWLFDHKSKHFLDLRIALRGSRGAMKGNRNRLKEMIADSKELKSLLMTELETKGQ